MPYIAKSPEDYKDTIVGNGQCVAFVKAASQAPQTSFWKQGVKVRGSNLKQGTAIATFQDGKYQNRTNGDSHAAIYVRQDATGIYVWDQWKGHAVSERLIRFKGGKGTPNNDGDAYSVIDNQPAGETSPPVETKGISKFTFGDKSIELPAILLPQKARSDQPSSWLGGQYQTVRLTEEISALRVHTDGKAYPPTRVLAAPQSSRWILLGDVIKTSAGIAGSRTLPALIPASMVAFTHVSIVKVHAGSVLNIGLAAPALVVNFDSPIPHFGGWGGEFQGEFVSGPTMVFSLLEGKRWHGGFGTA